MLPGLLEKGSITTVSDLGSENTQYVDRRSVAPEEPESKPEVICAAGQRPA